MSDDEVYEAEREVRPIEVHLKCAECNVDVHLMKYDQNKCCYINKCPICKSEYKSKQKYPYIKYVPK